MNKSKKNVSRPSNPPDESAQHVSKKIPVGTNYSSIFSAKVQNLAVFFNYLHDSNSIFGPRKLNQKEFRAAQTRHDSVGTLEVKGVSAVELVAELRAMGVPMSATRLSTSLSGSSK